MLIAGGQREAESGRTFEVTNPATGEVIARVPLRGCRRPPVRSRGGDGSGAGLGRHLAPRSRQDPGQDGFADPRADGRDGRAADPRAGQAASRGGRRGAGSRERLRVLCRARLDLRGRPDQARRRARGRSPVRADRGDRGHHPLEHAGPPLRLEGRSIPPLRERPGREACLDRPAHAPGARRVLARGGAPSRSAQRRHRPGRDRRRGTGHRARGPESLVHGLVRDGQTRYGPRRGPRGQAHARARRLGPDDCLRRRRPR